MANKKVVLKLDLHDGKAKQKALKTVSSLAGLEAIAMDMKEKKLTAIGDVDPVEVVSRLRRYWQAEILTVGPAKEPEKKKEEPKKEEADKKKEEEKRIAEFIKAYTTHYPPYPIHYPTYPTHDPYYLPTVEENPNSCVIC